MADETIEQASDDLAAAVGAAQEGAPAVAGEAATAAEPTAPEEPEAAEPEKPAEPPPDFGKFVRENARLARALERRQAELAGKDERIAELERITRDHVLKGDTSRVERLLGLTPDEYGEVEVGGSKTSAAVVAELAEVRPRLEVLERTVLAQQEEAQRVELADAVMSAISQVRGADPVLSQLGPETVDEVDEIIATFAGGPITQAYEKGTLTGESAAEMLSGALDRTKRLFGIFGAAQVKTNKQHAEIEKVKPGGTPAVKPEKAWHEMSRREQDEFTRRERELLEASRGE